MPRAVKSAESHLFLRQCERLAVIGNPFLHFHCTLYSHPWQINHNQMLAAARGTLCSTEEKWGLMLAWQPNLSTHRLDWTRGHYGLPVTTITHKQSEFGICGLAWSIKALLWAPQYLSSQCCGERERDSSSWGKCMGELPLGLSSVSVCLCACYLHICCSSARLGDA